MSEVDVKWCTHHRSRAERFNSWADGLEDVKSGSYVFRKVFFLFLGYHIWLHQVVIMTWYLRWFNGLLQCENLGVYLTTVQEQDAGDLNDALTKQIKRCSWCGMTSLYAFYCSQYKYGCRETWARSDALEQKWKMSRANPNAEIRSSLKIREVCRLCLSTRCTVTHQLSMVAKQTPWLGFCWLTIPLPDYQLPWIGMPPDSVSTSSLPPISHQCNLFNFLSHNTRHLEKFIK